MFSCEYYKIFKNTNFEERTSADGCFRLLLKVDYFTIYCSYSALIHFTTHVYLYRRWAALCIFLLGIDPWQEINKTTIKWKLAISDRNNDYFCTNWLKAVFFTGFKKASDVYIQYTLLCVRNILQNTVSLIFKITIPRQFPL